MDSNLAEDGFPGLINHEFLGSFCSTNAVSDFRDAPRKITSLLTWQIAFLKEKYCFRIRSPNGAPPHRLIGDGFGLDPKEVLSRS